MTISQKESVSNSYHTFLLPFKELLKAEHAHTSSWFSSILIESFQEFKQPVLLCTCK